MLNSFARQIQTSFITIEDMDKESILDRAITTLYKERTLSRSQLMQSIFPTTTSAEHKTTTVDVIMIFEAKELIELKDQYVSISPKGVEFYVDVPPKYYGRPFFYLKKQKSQVRTWKILIAIGSVGSFLLGILVQYMLSDFSPLKHKDQIIPLKQYHTILHDSIK
jgi:hypothetical protein